MNSLEVRAKESSAVHKKAMARYEMYKRIFDVVASILAMLILFIPFIVVMVIVSIDSPGASPIYVQDRVGKNGKCFRFYKFRSMRPNAEEMLESLLPSNEMDGPVFKIKNDPRITRFGRFMRKTGIDEIPQLINVIRGDMSLVGPRPPLPREVERYTDEQLARLSVTPGITCYWQVQPSRNSLSFDDWFELDMKYIRERSFKNDMIIIFKTFGAVCGMEGV